MAGINLTNAAPFKRARLNVEGDAAATTISKDEPRIATRSISSASVAVSDPQQPRVLHATSNSASLTFSAVPVVVPTPERIEAIEKRYYNEALCYLFGSHDPRQPNADHIDYGKVITRLKRLTNSKYARNASYILGILYSQGKVAGNHRDAFNIDFQKSNSYLEKAANLGSNSAHVRLAQHYMNGLVSGISDSTNQINYGKAIEHFKAAALSSDAHASYSLGYCYEMGMTEGNTKDPMKVDLEKAYRLYRRAAEIGHQAAHIRMQEVNDKLEALLDLDLLLDEQTAEETPAPLL